MSFFGKCKQIYILWAASSFAAGCAGGIVWGAVGVGGFNNPQYDQTSSVAGRAWDFITAPHNQYFPSDPNLTFSQNVVNKFLTLTLVDGGMLIFTGPATVGVSAGGFFGSFLASHDLEHIPA